MITGPTIIIAIILVIMTFVLPRRHALTTLVLCACLVPAHQHAYVFGLHFYVMRILILAGIVRILAKGESRPIHWHRLDKLVLMWAVVGAAAYILRRLDGQSVIFKSGSLLDILGIYWVGRQGIRSWDDVKSVCRVFALCALVLVPFVAFEWTTGSNPFQVLGGGQTAVREGSFRCKASFPHAIIAGSFWVCLVPLFVAMARTSRHRQFYWLATGAGIFIVVASNSSTPVGGLGAVLAFTAAYRWRHYGRYMAMSFFGGLTALHIVMKAPVWHLLCRIRIISGSTGWHRYLLIDQTIKHFREWALLGTVSTEHWGRGLHDVTNQYCLEAVRGGLVTLVLFIAILYVAVRTTGAYSRRPVGRDQQWLSWALCCAVIGHCVMFIGVSYFGQIQMLLYLTFALAGTVYEYNLVPATPRPRTVKAGYAAAPYRTTPAVAGGPGLTVQP